MNAEELRKEYRQDFGVPETILVPSQSNRYTDWLESKTLSLTKQVEEQSTRIKQLEEALDFMMKAFSTVENPMQDHAYDQAEQALKSEQ